MTEVLEFVVWSLFKGRLHAGKSPNHILCHGLQGGGAGSVRQHPNANLEQLKSRPWTDIPWLLGEDGEVILASLFLDCGIFTRLPCGTDNYYQLSGIPLSELTPLPSEPERSQNVPKALEQSLQLSNIRFVRNRIFYNKPSLNCDGRVKVGLPQAHVLQRFPEAGRPDHVIHILKYIFPRQHGLHNVFTSKIDRTETTQQFKDYTSREQEINAQKTKSKSPTWIPRRLRGGAFHLVRQIQRRQARCSYSQLLRHYCPVAPAPQGNPSYSLALKEPQHPSPSTEVLVTQAPLGSSIRSGRELPAIQDESNSSFLFYATPAARVSAFCRSVIARVLPKNAFGEGPDGQRNCDTIMARVDEFIQMRRFESMTLHNVVQGIRLKPIKWLSRPAKLEQKTSKTDHNKRLEILHEFVYYVFDSLLIPLIRHNFYVTESGTNRNRLFYFRHDVWRKLSAPIFATLKSSMYMPVNPNQLRQTLRTRNLGYSHVRLLPKEKGARPITNLKRRQLKSVAGKRFLGSSINSQMATVSSVLNFERGRNASPLGSALFTIHDIHGRLVQFKKTIPPGSRLYFTKVDIKSCFDSIPQEHLLRIVRCLFGEPSYRMTKYTQVKVVEGAAQKGKKRVQHRYIGIAGAGDDNAVFSEAIACDIALKKRRVVFTDTGNERLAARRLLLQLLQEHVGNNIVKIGRQYFRQTAGIPQGSVLSSLLCNYFYGAFEQNELGFLDSRSSLLLRLIDDFLLITTNDSIARRFLDVMARGNEQYGIIVNAEKSLANFDVSLQGQKVPRLHGSKFFPYCGIGIEMNTLQLKKDREKKDANIGNSLTVETCSRPGATLRRKAMTFLKLQMHSGLLDMSLNNRLRVITTLLGNFVEVAMKLVRYVASLPRSKRPSHTLLIDLFGDLVSACRKKCQKGNGDKGFITRAQMCWIAASAFERVLLQKQSQYRQFLVWLQSLREANSAKMKLRPAVLEHMLRETEEAFRGYVY
ncbi:Telomerase reverse transcriptase [Exophiala dermatitidis]